MHFTNVHLLFIINHPTTVVYTVMSLLFLRILLVDRAVLLVLPGSLVRACIEGDI